MSMANEKLLVHREKASREAARYSERMAEIVANADLSEEGRQRQQADLFVATRDRLAALRRAEQQELQSRWNKLEGDMFGAPGWYGSDAATRAISARDASQRASQISDADEAAALLHRAETDRDEVLARAIARHCMEQSEKATTRNVGRQWEAVFADFADRRELDSVIEELAQIEDMSKPQVFGPYSLPTPYGVPPQLIYKAARSDEMADA